MQFIRVLFRGEVTLSQAFWWYGFVMWLVSSTLMALISNYLWFSTTNHVAWELANQIFLTGWAFYSIPLSVGIGRSAKRYQGNKAWQILAYIFAAWQLCSLAVNLSGFFKAVFFG